MNEIKVVGRQDFMGLELPVIEGGFGEGMRVMTAHTIAQIHGIAVGEINRLTNDNIKEFEDGVDILNLLKVGSTHLEIKDKFGIELPPVAKNFFIYSEQGYMALVGLMRSEESREIRKKIRREYFSMRQIINSDEQKLAILTLNIYKGGQDAIASAKKLTEIEVEKATKPLLATIEVQKPLVSFADTLLKSKENILIGDFAKALCTDKINIGQNRLFKWLRDSGYLYKDKDSNMPYQKYVDNGLFVLKERVIDIVYNNTTKIAFTTLLTPKGQPYFYEKLKKEFGED